MSTPFLDSFREHLAGDRNAPPSRRRRPRRTWNLLSRLLGTGHSPRNLEAKSESLTGAREQLREITGELATLKSRLLQIVDSLPEPVTEDLLLLDTATEIRAIISCVIEDSLRPAIDDLWGASNLVRDQPTSRVHDKAAP